MKCVPLLLALCLGSAQALTQTLLRDGLIYAELESFAQDIRAGLSSTSGPTRAWRMVYAGKDLLLLEGSEQARMNGQQYRLAGKVVFEGGKGYAPLDGLRGLFQVNVVTASSVPSSVPSGSLSPAPGGPSQTTVAQPSYSREAILASVNRVRAQPRKCGNQQFEAAPPLKWNALLERAAAKHSRDMAERQFYAHADPQGKQPHERVFGEGYVGRMVGENIHALFTDDPEEVLRDWVDSPGHCANLMDPRYTQFGLGVYFLPYDSKKEYLRLWTQNFGG